MSCFQIHKKLGLGQGFRVSGVPPEADQKSAQPLATEAARLIEDETSLEPKKG